MIKLIVSFLLFIGLTACNPNESKLKKNTVRVTYKAFNSNDYILEYAGLELLDRYKVEIYSDKTFYTVFAAYYKNDWHNLPQTTTLIDYQFLTHYVFNQDKIKLLDTPFVYNKFEHLFRVDTKSNDILKNDSLYFAINKNNFYTAPLTISVDCNNQVKSKIAHIFDDDEIIPLSIRNFEYPNEIRDYKHDQLMVLGLVIADYPGKIDFKKLLEYNKEKLISIGRLYESKDENYDMIPRVDSSFYIK